MRAVVLAFVALLVVGCHFDSPVFTPNPVDYPCHDASGAAVPDGVVCEYVAGKASCCRANFSCRPAPFFCAFEGDPNWATNTFEARKRVTEARTESR